MKIPVRRIVFILVSCFLLNGCRAFYSAPTPTPTVTLSPEPSPTLTRTVKPTGTPWPTVPVFTPTPRFGNQPWRFEVIPIGEKAGDDQSVNQQWKDSVNLHAVNLSVVKPYFWEEIRLPDPTRYVEIREYYIKTAQEHGYQLGRDEQGETVAGENTYLMTFYQGFDLADPRVVLEFWPKTTQYDAFMLIFYSNPK